MFFCFCKTKLELDLDFTSSFANLFCTVVAVEGRGWDIRPLVQRNRMIQAELQRKYNFTINKYLNKEISRLKSTVFYSIYPHNLMTSNFDISNYYVWTSFE